jgi:hypothetical protein
VITRLAEVRERTTSLVRRNSKELRAQAIGRILFYVIKLSRVNTEELERMSYAMKLLI